MFSFFLPIAMVMGFLELIGTGVFAYAVAHSKWDSKKIIRSVLIGTGVYVFVTVISILTIRVPVLLIIQHILTSVFFIVLFGILGAQTGNKFNIPGFFSLLAYVISIFVFPVISNKYEDTILFKSIELRMDNMGIALTPKQYEIFKYSYYMQGATDGLAKYYIAMQIMFIGVVVSGILLFDMMLIRRNRAQMVMGGILSLFAGGIIYLDYCIFHSIVGEVLSKAGFSLSPFCILIILFAVGTVVSAYICSRKEVVH